MSAALHARCDLDELEKAAHAVNRDHREYSNEEYDAFVKAADAATVLELVRRLREAEDLLAEAAARLSRHRDVIDQWVCENVLDHFDQRAVDATRRES